MKKIIFTLFAFSLLLTACNKKSETTLVATDVVPQAATEVLPAAAPVPELGVVATDVIPNE